MTNFDLKESELMELKTSTPKLAADILEISGAMDARLNKHEKNQELKNGIKRNLESIKKLVSKNL